MRSENLNIGLVRRDPQAYAVLQRLAATVVRWRVRARERHELARLDAWAKRDLGLTDAEIWRETRKAPWQA